MPDESKKHRTRRPIDHPIDDNYSIRIDPYASKAEDRAQIWSKRWRNAKMAGRLFYRYSKTATGIIMGAMIRLAGKSYSVARLVWKHVLRRPLRDDSVITHRDGDPRNNHPDNLRQISKSENADRMNRK
jgi:hypothetical protein